MKNRKFGIGKNLFIFILLLVVLFTVGCGKEFNIDSMVESDRDAGNLIVVGVSQVGSESMWRTANTNSVQEAFTKENGYMLLFDNARQKQENQIKAIRSFISQQVDYIIFSPIQESGWDTVLQEAKEAGIPVILMDRKVKVEDNSLYTTWVGSDFYEEGRKAGVWLEYTLAKKERDNPVIDIVILQGTEGASSAIGRTQGFMDVAKKHSDWNLMAQVDGEYTTAKGREVMSKVLGQYEKVDVLVSQNDDMTLGALEALAQYKERTGKDITPTIVSFDATSQALRLVQQGTIDVEIECNPLQGKMLQQVIQKLEQGEQVEKEYFVEEKIFTKVNVQEYIGNRTY